MALTNAICDAIMAQRLEGLTTAAGMTIATDMESPYAWALRQVGGTTADASTATDVELATVAVADTDKFLDLAEYRALQNILGRLDDVDLTTGPRSEKFSQLAVQAQKKLDGLEKRVRRWLRPLKAGYLKFDFLEHNE